MGTAMQTRRRVLDAATIEFAAHGIAGARVDRIAAAADVNKAQMYAYYKSKDGLFDAVFTEHLDQILDAIPVTATDLPAYAASIYDIHLERPDFVRLAAWARLERTPTGDLIADSARHEVKVAAITEAQHQGLVTAAFAPADVLAMVVAIAMTWSPISITYAGSQDEDPAEHERRRAMVREVTRRAVAP
jgi:AcrR family transcriptional regulator